MGAAAVKGNALLANFLEADRNVHGVVSIVKLDVNVLFADGLEVAGAREFAEAGFQGVFVEWMALAQGNTAAHETIIEFVQPLEFDAVDNIRKRIAEIEFEANGMLHRIENWIGIYRL